MIIIAHKDGSPPQRISHLRAQSQVRADARDLNVRGWRRLPSLDGLHWAREHASCLLDMYIYILSHPRWNTGREASEINRPRENSARATR